MQQSPKSFTPARSALYKNLQEAIVFCGRRNRAPVGKIKEKFFLREEEDCNRVFLMDFFVERLELLKELNFG
jgi:hypothetical protein